MTSASRGPVSWRSPLRLPAHPTFEERSLVITLTDNAAIKVKELIAQEGDEA